MVHELAHLNGADGLSHDAERSVRQCGFGPQYDPTIMGSLSPLANELRAFG